MSTEFHRLIYPDFDKPESKFLHINKDFISEIDGNGSGNIRAAPTPRMPASGHPVRKEAIRRPQDSRRKNRPASIHMKIPP